LLRHIKSYKNNNVKITSLLYLQKHKCQEIGRLPGPIFSINRRKAVSFRKALQVYSAQGGVMDRGYMGKILMVDLTTREVKEEVVPEEVYEYRAS